MDFWNDNNMFVTQKKWKIWTTKKCQSNVKIKINNKTSSNEDFIIEMHWNFAINFLKIKNKK
jgi:hypothetical protein